MKLNKFFLFAAAALATVFSSCSSDDDITVGEQDSAKPFVYLSDANKTSVTLDPTDPTELTFTVCRRDSVSAVEIPLTVTGNDQNIFNVPSTAAFAAGEKTATVKVSFPNCPIGTPSSFTVGFDSDLAGLYKTGTREQTFTVTRVKWNSIGMGTMAENFWFEETFDVEIMQRDDNHNQYRIMKPFEAYASILDGNQSEYIELTILKPKDVIRGVTISQKNLVFFSNTNTGYFHTTYSQDVWMYHPSTFTSLANEASFGYNRVLSYQEDGKTPGQIQLAPYYYMTGVGGWNQTQADGIVIITLPGFVPEYEADIETDFEYSEAFSGELQSGLLGKTLETSLYVGTCTVNTDDCDKRFEEQYGKIYKVVSPYADGYHLTFLAKKDAIALPEGPEYALQPTGLTSLGKDVYAKINPDASSFEDGKVTLNITFQDKKGEVIYGTTDEIVQNVKWNSLGTGLWTDAFVATLYGAEAVQYPVEVLECESKPGLYRVMDPYSNSTYPYAEDDCAPDGSYLTVDATDPDGVFIPYQELGFDWGDGAIALQSYGSYMMSKYDAAVLKKNGYLGTLKNGVITLPYLKMNDTYSCTALAFIGGDGYYADTANEFQFLLPSAVKPAAKKAAAKKAASVRNFRKFFVGKKANVKKSKFSVRKSGKAPIMKSYVKTNPSKIEAPAF